MHQQAAKQQACVAGNQHQGSRWQATATVLPSCCLQTRLCMAKGPTCSRWANWEALLPADIWLLKPTLAASGCWASS